MSPALPTDLILDSGAHNNAAEGYCIMEAVSFVAGEPFSDSPECASPVIAAFLRSWNDGLSTEDRNRLLPALIPRLVGTRTTAEDEETRAWMATDWLVRVHTPAWLRLAGLEDHARALESLARIADATLADKAQPTIESAREASAAAWAASSAAARGASSAAAWNASSAAARGASSAAARGASWAASSAAARGASWAASSAAAWGASSAAARGASWAASSAAAWGAADTSLRPTVEALQLSALALVEAMIEVGRPHQTGGNDAVPG